MAESCPWPPPVLTQTFRLRSNTAIFRSPLTGAGQIATRPGGRWEFDVSTSLLDNTRMGQWLAFLAYVQEEGLTFYWSHYPKGLPQAYPTGTGWGTPLVNGAAQTGRSLVIDGLTAGATLKMGDAVSFYNGTFRELHLLKADVTANGSGQATLAITPAIHISPADNASVYLNGNDSNSATRAACEVIFADPAQASWAIRNYQMDSSFKLVELLKG